jgi:hypothetical protein
MHTLLLEYTTPVLISTGCPIYAKTLWRRQAPSRMFRRDLRGRDGDIDSWEVDGLVPGVRGTRAVQGYDKLRDRRSLARWVRPDGRLGLWDRLTAQATLHPEMPQAVTELVSTRYGQELYPLAIPAPLVGRLFRHSQRKR